MTQYAMCLAQGTARSTTGTGVCPEHRPPEAIPRDLLRLSTTHSQGEITFPLTHFHLESPTALRSRSDTVICRAAVHPIITVLHTQNGQELPIPLYAVPGVEQPAGHSTGCQGWGHSWGSRGELHLYLQSTDSTMNGNMFYFLFSTCKEKGGHLKC